MDAASVFDGGEFHEVEGIGVGATWDVGQFVDTAPRFKEGIDVVIVGHGVHTVFDPPEQFKAPVVFGFGVGCGSCNVRNIPITPDSDLRSGGPVREGPCPDVVVGVHGKGVPVPFEAEGFTGPVEVELVPAHAPDAIGLGLAEEGVFWVVEDIPCGSVWFELEFVG